MLDGKANAIKKLALRLMPKVKKAEYERLQSYLHGHSIQNMGAEEGHTMKEEVNDLFEVAFPQDPNRPMAGSPNSTMSSGLGEPRVPKTSAQKGKTSKPAPSIQMHKTFDKVSEAIDRKANQSGIKFDVLAEVFSRGLAAWTEDCKVNQVQYAFARINSYINQGKTYFNEDADLHELLPATLDSYAKRSNRDAVGLIKQIGNINNKKYANRTNAQPLNKLGSEDEDQKTRLLAKLKQRKLGQALAVDKLDRMKTEQTEIIEACWKKYKQVGTKLKNGRRVPNCVPEQVEPEVQHKNTKKRKGIENVDRNTNDKTELGKQTEIMRKIIEQSGNKVNEPNKITAVQGKKIKEDIEPTDSDYHAKVHQDLQWHAGRNRGRSMGAANYHYLMSLDNQSHLENYYEKTVLPILKKHRYPTPPKGPADGGNQKYHAAVQEIIKNWENEPRVDESTKTGNKVNDPKKRLQGTDSLDKAYRADTPCEEIEENAVTADREPVIVAAHKDAYGNVIPAKAIFRKTRRNILKTGDTHDGESN
jgi:hypothetical protein